MPHEKIKRTPFSDIFELQSNGDLVLKQKLMLGSDIFEPDTVIKQGQTLAGVDLHKRRGLDLAIVTTSSGIHILRGFFVGAA